MLDTLVLGLGLLYVLGANALLGTKHLIAYAAVIIVLVAAVALVTRSRAAGR